MHSWHEQLRAYLVVPRISRVYKGLCTDTHITRCHHHHHHHQSVGRSALRTRFQSQRAMINHDEISSLLHSESKCEAVARKAFFSPVSSSSSS